MITLDEAKQALLRSGYLLESRIEALFRRKAYYVEANSVFPDRATGTSREIDVYALSATKAGPGDTDFLFTALLIECVNNPEPLVLLTKPPLLGYLHHYCRGRVATQYCSFQKKKQQPHDWMAWHDEAHFDAFRKLCTAVDHSVTHHFHSWALTSREPLNIQAYYPVVVVQGELIEARASGGSVRLLRRPHIAFRRSEFVEGEEREYQIDVVQERHLRRYIALVERETKRMATLLRRRHREVRTAIERIARHARRFKSPERIRAAMDF